MKRLVIKSTNPKDTRVDIEEKLEKAVESLKLQREKKEFRDKYLLERKQSADTAIRKVFSHLIDEIEKVL